MFIQIVSIDIEENNLEWILILTGLDTPSQLVRIGR